MHIHVSCWPQTGSQLVAIPSTAAQLEGMGSSGLYTGNFKHRKLRYSQDDQDDQYDCSLVYAPKAALEGTTQCETLQSLSIIYLVGKMRLICKKSARYKKRCFPSRS